MLVARRWPAGSSDGWRGRWRWPAHPPHRRCRTWPWVAGSRSWPGICRFSAWPAPTTVFLTTLGGYSAMRRPRCAGASSAMPRAWPSFRVERASLLTNVSSIAASSGLKLDDHRDQALVELAQAVGELALTVRGDEAARHVGEPHAVGFDDAPTGPAQAGVDADDANRLACAWPLIAQRAFWKPSPALQDGNEVRLNLAAITNCVRALLSACGSPERQDKENRCASLI